MADNVGYTPGTGASVAADDVGGVLHQRVKLTIGDDGVSDGDVSAANPLPVSLPATVATAAKQDTGNTSLASIDGKVTACNTGAVVVSSSALPSGAATATKQDTGNTSLASIDGKITAVNTGAVVVSSSALPSGAATAAKQPALGTAGTASTDVITVQGIASMTALKVDGSAVTQPVSGSVSVSNFPASQAVTGTFWQATQPVSLATNTPDVTDRAARELGRVRLWDGTDELTLLPLRTVPATEKVLPTVEIPNRLPTYGCATTLVTPAITVGVKELLAIWHASTSTKDKYIVEITATGLVTTASSAGRSTLRVSTITTAPTGGTELTKTDISGAGASDMTNTMQVKTGGGTIGSTFIRKLVWYPTQPVGRLEVPLFQASNPGNGIQMRAGSGVGISIDIEREVAHTALVDVWEVSIRWLEI